MKMTKYQWRMLMSTILDIHNDLLALEERQVNWVKGFSARLDAIERRLPPEPVTLEAVSSDDGQQPLPDAIDYGALRWRTQNEDGTWRDCID